MILSLLIKVTLLFLLGFLVAGALQQRSAAARHLVWMLSLSGALLLALTTPVAPRVPLRIAVWQSPAENAPITMRGPQRTTGPFTAGTSLTATGSAALPGATARTRGVFASLSPAQLLIALWLLGALSVAGWWGLGHLGLARLLRRSTPLEDADWTALIRRVATRSGVAMPVRLFRSPAVGSPVIWGARRPVVLLPDDADAWPLERREVVLAHELAHAARGDYLAQAIAWLACALFWFHPLAWLAARRLRVEGERACDDHVLVRGTPGTEYASHLLEVARHSRALRPGGAVAIGMARRSHFEGRVLAVLDDSQTRKPPPSRARLAAWATLVVLVLPLAALRPAPILARKAVAPVAIASAPAPEPTQSEQQRPGSQAFDSTFEKTVAAVPGEQLVLDLETGGGVAVTAWEEPRVRVRARLTGANWRGTQITLEREGGKIRLHSWQEGGQRSFSTSHEFEILVPQHFNLRFNSAGGAVSIVGIEGEFTGTTGGGGYVIERASGRADLSTGGGEIRVSNSELSGTVSTGGGAVQLSGVRGGLRGTSGSGPVITRESGGSSSSTGDLSEVRVEGERYRVERAREKLDDSRAREARGREVETVRTEEIRRLENRIAELRAELDRNRAGAAERSADAKAELERTGREMEARAAELKAELDRRTGRRDADEPLIVVDGVVQQRARSAERAPGLLHIQKAGGAIILEEAPDGAELNTGGGRIEVGPSSGWVSASTGGGDIKIGPASGSVRAGTGAGNVQISVVGEDGRERSIEVQSGSGSAVLVLPPGFSGRFELEAAYTESFGRHARIQSDWELSQNETTEWERPQGGSPRKYVRATGRVGNGSGLIRINIVNGDITIRKGRP